MLAICHTHYSLQTGIGSPREWAEAAVERGYSALAVADADGLYGAVEFAKAAEAVGLRAIIGATISLDRDSSSMVLAPDEHGYRQLCRLLTARHLLPVFELAQVAGHLDGLLFLARQGGVLRRLAAYVPGDRLFALAPASLSAEQPTLWDALPHGCRQAFVPDAWFLGEADRVPFGYLRQLRTGVKGQDDLTARHPGAVLPGARDWRERYPDQTASDMIEEQCRFRFPFGRVILPRIQLPAEGSASGHLETLCRQGLERRYPSARRDEAAARLRKELEVIIGNGFADYFLYVHEITEFARSRNIPVGVRGSAASSIVSYVLGFTECCPIEHDLYFERFMNGGRRDCPDIDLDIADHRRDEVIQYCYKHWGEERVAMASAIQFYRTRGALRDAGRLLGLPPEQVGHLVESPDGDRRCPELYRIAGHLVGRPRHLGVHCAGLFVTPEPIADLVPLAMAAKGVRVTHFEKDQAEAIGLVKMDLLGNSCLSVLDAAQKLVRAAGREFTEPGPALDFKVNRLFANGDTLGVYQCESPGMRQLCQAIMPRTSKEVAMTLSLIRPGPAGSGMKDAFVRRRRGDEPVTYLHPRMAEFLGDTYGVMLYQEDVMKVAVNLAGYDMHGANGLRQTLSKASNPAALQEERLRFMNGKAAVGLTPAQAETIWESVSRFSKYAYCKAHATVYGRLAWLTARLKAHHPREFLAAVLNHHKSMYPARVFVWDALRHGIPVLPPDIQSSGQEWMPVQHGVLAGLDLVRGVSGRTCAALLQERERQPFASLSDLLRRVPFARGELERLVLVGACRCWGPRSDLLAELQETGPGGCQPLLIGPDMAHPVSLLRAQLELTGIPFCMHPVELVHNRDICLASDMKRKVGRTVTMAGILDSTKLLHTQPKGGKPEEMSFVTLEDASGMYDAILFPDRHVCLSRLFVNLGPYQLTGRIVRQWGTCSLEVADAAPLPLPA